MAVLQNTSTGRQIQLQPRHLVGRSHCCSLCLEDGTVSAEHASVFWGDGYWQVRDLGSRNGTWIDGERLKPGVAQPILAGQRVAFGTGDNPWCLVDPSPPLARAIDSEGTVIEAIGGVLALPDPEHPTLTIHRNTDGDWLLEDDTGERAITDGEEVRVAENLWRLHLPNPLPGTVEQISTSNRPTLRFRVSADEEYVELELVDGQTRRSLGARTHHEILLALARARIADDRVEALATDRGWVYVDDLKRMLRADATYLRVGIYRARQQLASAGVLGAPQMIQRRVATGQIRLGTDLIDVVSI